MTLVSLFGRPGAGKSSVGNQLAARHGFTHLALGAMLKDLEILREIGIDPLEMQQAVANGQTVSNPKLYPWLDDRIRGIDRVVVDGYPRAAISATPFAALVDSLPKHRKIYALLLDCPVEVTHPRLKVRGRPDDDERIPRRDHEYETVQRPLLAMLPCRVQCVNLDASRPASDVFADVERILGLRGLQRQG